MTNLSRRERRWIILADDGRHVTIGRHTDPKDEEIERAARALQSMATGGWLAILDGAYYRSGEVALMMVRKIALTNCDWDAAVTAFLEIRCRTLNANLP